MPVTLEFIKDLLIRLQLRAATPDDQAFLGEPGPLSAKTQDERRQVAQEYLRIRRRSEKLNSVILDEYTEAGEFDASARALGLLRAGVVVFQNEHEMAVVLDHMMFCQHRDGLTAVDRFRAAAGFAEDSLEDAWLRALQESRYSVFLVTGIIPELGVEIRDIISGEQIELVDINLCRGASLGIVLATRVLRLPRFAMTTGAGLPVFGEGPLRRIQQHLERRHPGLANVADLDPQSACELQTFITRTCLQSDYAERFVVERPGEFSSRRAQGRTGAESDAPRRTPRIKIGRNEPCPCGSGAKYKRCCGRGGR